VLAAGVIGKADPLRGELPIAFVELREGKPSMLPISSVVPGASGGLQSAHGGSAAGRVATEPTGKIMRRELKTMV